MADPVPLFTGIVLAGGHSTRMGTDKAFLVPGDEGPPLGWRAVTALRQAGARRCLVVGGHGARLVGAEREPAGTGEKVRTGEKVEAVRTGEAVEAVPDDEPGTGPLGGILTALRVSRDALNVVLTCDMPLIDAATVEVLVRALAARPDAQAVMPVVEGRRQVLTAAYRDTAAAPLARAFAAGERSVRRALAAVAVTELTGLDPAPLVDLDRPGDVDHYARVSRRRRFGPDRSTGRE